MIENEKPVDNRIFLPEVRLFNFIEQLLKVIKKDFETESEEATILFEIFNNNAVEQHNYYKIAKELFGRVKGDNPREIGTRLFFDRERAHLPTIHISLPGEMAKNDGMGFDEGFQDVIFNDNFTERQATLTRRFATKYDILMTSDNPMEVVIMYHTIRAVLISFSAALQLMGFHLPVFSGQDLRINEELVPNHIMIRALSLNFEYDVTVPSAVRERIMKTLEFDFTINTAI